MIELAHDRIGAGRALLCLHPIGLDRTCWDAFARHRPDGFELIRVDLAGHGTSSDRPAEMDIADDADAVAALIDRLDLGPAAVMGVSFGGMIAQTLAARHPEHVAALIAAACPAGISPENRTALADRGKPALEGGMAAIVETTMERWFSQEFQDAPEARAVRERLATDSPANWAAAWGAISRFDLRDRLGEIRAPVLCVAGGADVATPMAAMETLANGVRDGKLEIIPDAPHMLHIETAATFAVAVSDFLARLQPPVRAHGGH